MIMFGFGTLPGAPLPPGKKRFGFGPPPAGSDPPATEQLLANGWGYAYLNPSSVQADNGAGLTKGIIGLTNKGKTAFYAHKHWHETMDGGFKEYFYTLEQDKIDFLDQFLTRIENFLKQRILTEK